MKKLLLLLLISFSGFSQETVFKFSPNGFTNYVVINCEGKSKAELYKKVLDWVAVTYNNPKEVIKAEIIDDYVRIEGIKKNVPHGSMMGLATVNTYRYQIEISVKDEKYKFDVINLEDYTAPSQYLIGGWATIDFSDTKRFYKSNGTIKSSYKHMPQTLPAIFNDLNAELYNYIISNETITKKNDW